MHDARYEVGLLLLLTGVKTGKVEGETTNITALPSLTSPTEKNLFYAVFAH